MRHLSYFWVAMALFFALPQHAFGLNFMWGFYGRGSLYNTCHDDRILRNPAHPER